MNIADLADRHMHELSGGQRQRVVIAQGLVQPHDVLLLDEPMTGLDINSASTIDSLIHGERSDGCSVILTTHDLDEARASDWVVLVSRRVLSAGRPRPCAHGAIWKWPTAWVDCTNGRGSSTTRLTIRTIPTTRASRTLTIERRLVCGVRSIAPLMQSLCNNSGAHGILGQCTFPTVSSMLRCRWRQGWGQSQPSR